MKCVVFEDDHYEKLYPLSLTRAVFELKCGVTSLVEKIRRTCPDSDLCFFTREYLAATVKKRHPAVPVNDLENLVGSDLLFINGRCLFLDMPADVLPKEGWAGENGQVVLATIEKGTLEGFQGDDLEGLLNFIQSNTPKMPADYKIINHPWDLINYNSAALHDDFQHLNWAGIEGSMAPEATIYGPKERVAISKGAQVHPFVCIDTNGGPVFIDEGALIHPFTHIEGPCYIGTNSIILGAKVREGCSIGPVCRIGGEVEESIFHGYTNKAHDGFIGHAYVGEWVNLGALTTNSDLKNDYSTISVKIQGKPVDTGSIKVGSFFGDHTKTSIGTYLNTGSNIGALCVVVSSGGVLPKYLPSGSWFIKNSVTKGFGLKSMLRTAEMVMGRRNVPYTEEDAELLKKVYEITKPDRDMLIEK
jgi:UDP-N-acetylglucosamine diphosphorylase/glucosamine-1-phosphate N-acetyltransferase